jgi:hypothetical protein
MQHAIATAHKNAEQKKGDTLSLPHNKRATDADATQKPANDAMPQAAEKALQQAAQALHDGVSNVSSIDADIPRIVVRQDVRGKQYVFFVDSEDRAAGTIEMFDVSTGKAEKETVKVEFYKQATKPVENVKEKDKAVEAVIKTFGVSRVIVRARLVKEGSLQQDEEGKANTVDVAAWKQRLIAAVTKAIMEA